MKKSDQLLQLSENGIIKLEFCQTKEPRYTDNLIPLIPLWIKLTLEFSGM